MLPAVLIPAFFYTVNLGALENLAHGARGFQLQGIPHPHGHRLRRHRDVTGPHPGDRHPRWVLRPALHDADPPHGPAVGAHGRRRGGDRRPVPARAGHRLRGGGALRHRCPRRARFHRAVRSLGTGVHRHPLCRGPQDGESGGGQRHLRRLLPSVLPERRRRAQAGPHRLVLHHRHLQPGDLRAGRPALAHHLGMAGRNAAAKGWPPWPGSAVVSMSLALLALRGRINQGA